MDALPFQAHANYGNWSIDFGFCIMIVEKNTVEPIAGSFRIKQNCPYLWVDI